MKVDTAIERILLGEAMRSIAASYREKLLIDLGLDPEECGAEVMLKETMRFMAGVSRDLGEKCEGDARALAALRDWVMRVEDYDAYDSLLTQFDFDGRDVLIRRGRMLFPGPLTAHWDS